MLNLFLSFFSNLKLNKYVIYSLCVLFLFILAFFGYKSVLATYNANYDKGYNAGVLNEQNKLKDEYNKALESKIKENTETLKKQYENQINFENNKEKIKTIYVDRIKEVEKIVKDSSTMNKVECEMSDDEFNSFNKNTRLVK